MFVEVQNEDICDVKRDDNDNLFLVTELCLN